MDNVSTLVIQISLLCVYRYMYGQYLDLNIMPVNVFRTYSFNNVFFEGKNVTKDQDWQTLLMKVASEHCRESFRKIFDHFVPQLVGQGMKSGLSKELATELAQETMMKVWKQASSYEQSKGEVGLWIYIIARNLRYDHFRKLRNDPLKIGAADIYSDIDLSNSNEHSMESIFDLKLLSENITKLPIEQRFVIQKIYFEGFTQEEIAQSENIPLGTIKSRVRLAISTLKKLIGGNLS